MHLTCKNTSIKPDRNGSVKGPERYQAVAIAIASVGAKLKLLEKEIQMIVMPVLGFAGRH